MSEPFLAEVKIFGFNFPPRGWARCDGQILPINQNQSLFSLIGTIYGGDGRTSFGLPDLRGRTPVHVGDGVTIGLRAGEEGVTLTEQQMPVHDHGAQATNDAPAGTNQANAMLTQTSGGRFGILPYGPGGAVVSLVDTSVTNTGGSAAHNNMQPFLTLNFCIALSGQFPPRN